MAKCILSSVAFAALLYAGSAVALTLEPDPRHDSFVPLMFLKHNGDVVEYGIHLMNYYKNLGLSAEAARGAAFFMLLPGGSTEEAKGAPRTQVRNYFACLISEGRTEKVVENSVQFEMQLEYLTVITDATKGINAKDIDFAIKAKAAIEQYYKKPKEQVDKEMERIGVPLMSSLKPLDCWKTRESRDYVSAIGEDLVP